jgi:hypothetical protein
MHAPWFLNSASRAAHLRIGVLLDGPTLPACLAEALQHIVSSNFARLELAVFNTEAPQLRDNLPRQPLLFALYQSWDARRIHESPDPLKEVDCGGYFKDVESIPVTPIAEDGCHRFPEEAVRRIRDKNLDVLIKFSSLSLRGEILHAARYGLTTTEIPMSTVAARHIFGRFTRTISSPAPFYSAWPRSRMRARYCTKVLLRLAWVVPGRATGCSLIGGRRRSSSKNCITSTNQGGLALRLGLRLRLSIAGAGKPTPFQPMDRCCRGCPDYCCGLVSSERSG